MDRFSIAGYSSGAIEDIICYMAPDITVTDHLYRGEKKKIEASSQIAFHMDEIERFRTKVVDNECLIIITQPYVLTKDFFKNIKDKEIKRFSVITNLFKSVIDTDTFDYSLSNDSMLPILNKNLDRPLLFSTEIMAGKKHHQGDTVVTGIGTHFDFQSTKIPLAVTGEMPFLEMMSADRVGMMAIPGLGGTLCNQLEAMGIDERKKLAGLHPSELMDIEGIGPYRSCKWIASAKSMEENKIYRINEDDLAHRHRIYVDIETDDLNPSIIWHIGVLDDETDEYFGLLEEDPDKAGSIIKQFAELLEKRIKPNSCLLAWYGSGFDYPHLGNFIKRYALEYFDLWESVEKIDLMKWVKSFAGLTSRSSKLDDVASKLGYKWQVRGLDGKEVGTKYTEYMYDRTVEVPWEDFKLYGMDDVLSMKYIYEKIKDAPLLFSIKEMERSYRYMK